MIGLKTADYGGGNDESETLDSIDDVFTKGIDFLVEQFNDWKEVDQDSCPDEFNARDFDRVMKGTYLRDVLWELVNELKDGKSIAKQYLGRIDEINAWIYMKRA